MNMHEMASVMRVDVSKTCHESTPLERRCRNSGKGADSRTFNKACPAVYERHHHDCEYAERQQPRAQQRKFFAHRNVAFFLGQDGPSSGLMRQRT